MQKSKQIICQYLQKSKQIILKSAAKVRKKNGIYKTFCIIVHFFKNFIHFARLYAKMKTVNVVFFLLSSNLDTYF